MIRHYCSEKQKNKILHLHLNSVTKQQKKVSINMKKITTRVGTCKTRKQNITEVFFKGKYDEKMK